MSFQSHEVARLETGFEALAREHDQLVQTVLDGVVTLENMEVRDSVLDLLLAEAKGGFEQAARKMVGGSLDLYSEAGLADARRTYNDVTRYREMISWIMDAIRRAYEAAGELPSVEAMMKDSD